jgi:DeoR/GlpR family transcriptional regulator of sugar metabolism
MRPLERQRAIQSLLERQGDLGISEACRALGISPATARRDFAELAGRGAAEKTWGGLRRAGGGSAGSDMVPSSLRETLNPREKERIARRAAELVKDGDVLIVDGGTTTLCLAPHLANRRVRILTNSILIAHRIDAMRSVNAGAEVFLTGGFLYPASGLLVGPEAVSGLSQYHADWAFLSVGGLDAEGATNTNHLVVEGERAMVRSARSVVVLADGTKWSRREMVRAFSWTEVDRLITDTPPPCALPEDLSVVVAA